MKIIIKKKKFLREKYHAVIVAENGKILFTSENYHNHQDCLHTASLFNLPITEG